MIVKFYSAFEKRANSTKQPDSGVVNTQVDCYLLDNTSILNPVFVIEKTVAMRFEPYVFTYAYVQDFERYYHVTNVVSSKNLWTIYLTVDVLATYRHEIRNSSQYVLRSGVTWDQDIIDGIYPTVVKDFISLGDGTSSPAFASSSLEQVSGQYQIYRRAGMVDGSQWSVDRTYFKQGMNAGGFIVGVVSDNGTGNTYYAMTRPSLVTFMNKILTLTPSDFTDTSSGVARALINAIQYIASITWFPAIPTIPGGVNPVSTINIGGYPVDNLSSLSIYEISSNYIEEFYFDLTLPKHPKRYTSTYGVLNWLTLSPYTQYNLYFAPFGNIPLDTTKLLYAPSIRVQWNIDFITGNSILKLYRGDYTDQIFYTATSNLGVSLPVSSLIVKSAVGLGLITSYTLLKSQFEQPSNSSIVSWFDNTKIGKWLNDPVLGVNSVKKDLSDLMDFLGFEKKDEVNGIDKVIDMGVDALASALGQVQTKGTPESFLAYFEIPMLYAWFLDIAEPDKDRFGRPLNKTVTLATISGGFVKCADSNVTFGSNTALPTLPERNQVNKLLNTGVFLE